MFKKTSLRSGKNEFKDNTFSSQEWSAPTMIDPHMLVWTKLVLSDHDSIKIYGF